jgi:beta-phosphoglucomutase
MLKALVFDYNGILVDDLKLHLDAYMRVAEDLGYRLNPDDLWALISATPDEKKSLFGGISDETWSDIRRRKDNYYYDMAATLDIIIPGALDVLKALAGIYPLALVSNTSRRYFEKCFPQEGIECFKETLFSEEMKRPKPSPDPLFRIIHRLQVNADECCYVGDAVSDVQMAKSAGVAMFGVTTGHHSEKDLRNAGADWIVNSLGEFAALIRNGTLPQRHLN